MSLAYTAGIVRHHNDFNASIQGTAMNMITGR